MTAAVRKKLNQEINAFVNTLTWPEKLPFPHRRISYDDFLSDPLLLIAAIREGIPFTLFELIQADSPFSEGEWAELLHLSIESLHHCRQEEGYRFKPIYAEKIIQMAEVVWIGLKVFGDMDRLKHWLNTPNLEIGHFRPMELLRDSYGKDLVLQELLRIGQRNFH